MFNPGPKSGSKRDVVTLAIMTAMALGILAYWGFGRARSNLSTDAVQLPGEKAGPLTEPDTNPFRKRAIENLKQDGAAEEASGEDERDVPHEDVDWLTDLERKAEAERVRFLPMLEEFTPVEPDALRGFRALLQDRVPGGYRPRLSVPATGGGSAIVDADRSGMTLESADGARVPLAWDALSIGEAYRIAREMTPPEASTRSRDLLYLAQLATLAGKTDDAAEFRAKAAVLHFRGALGDGAPEGAGPALYEAAADLVKTRSEPLPTKESERDALALDLLHLSRLASQAGRASEAAAHAKKALELDPLMEDEAAGRSSRSLDRWLLENKSWAWDPDQAGEADLQTANDLQGDSSAILHVYRYMRTLGPERLARVASKDPSYARLINLPRQTRGRAYRLECGFIRKYKTLRFLKRPEHLDSGVQEVRFVFLSAKDVPGGIYLVCVPHDVNFSKSDFLSVTGVYLRRWPYEKANGKWQWIPWIVASKIEKIELRGARGWGAFIYVLLGLGAIGGVALFFAARREWRELTVARDRLHSRRRAGRDLIRRKVAGAARASSAKGDGEGDAAAAVPSDEAKPSGDTSGGDAPAGDPDGKPDQDSDQEPDKKD